MFIRKLALFSLALAPSMIPSVYGIKQNLRNAKLDPVITETHESFDNSTISDYFIDEGESLRVDGLVRSLGSQGDWSSCSSSSQCASGCCSGKYSNNILKCTPLKSGFNPVSNGCVSGSSGGSGGGSSGSSGNAWLDAHNSRRQRYHSLYRKSYVPLKWSSSLENSARGWANRLLGSCSLQHARNTGQGENLAYTSWRASADQVLKMWVEDEDPAKTNGQYIWPNSGHFSQALWRGTKYLGCATATSSRCSIHVCRYIALGNCGIRGNEWRWADLVFADSSGCGPQCPTEGCF